MKRLINTAPLIVNCRTEVSQVCENMLGSLSMAALVVDDQGHVCGIVTQRDLLRYLVTKKYCCCASKVPVQELMSTPVEFATFDNVESDVKFIRQRYDIKFFPVKRNADNAHVGNIVGILTLEDIANYYLHRANLSSAAMT